MVGGKEKASELLGIIYQYPSNPRIRMRRFGEGACSGVRGAGVRSIGGGGHEGVRGRSERVKNITPSHTGATSRMKRALTNTNNGRHKRMAGRCAKNRPTQRPGSSLLRWHYSFSRTRWLLDTTATDSSDRPVRLKEISTRSCGATASEETPWKN